MTLLGKFLIFVNLALSVGMAAVALGLYANRIDWAGTRPAESESELKRLDAEIKNKKDLLERSYRRWDFEGKELARLEATGTKARQWYAEQLALLEKGRGANVPIDELVYQDGKIQLDANGYPKLQPSADRQVVARTFLDAEIRNVLGRIEDEIKATQAIMDDEKKLTLELNGVNGKPKGLRDLLAEMQAAVKRADEELLYVKRERINGQEAVLSLLHRQHQLKGRRETLTKENVAAQAR